MKFFFPDSSDTVDPSFEFETEKRNEDRVRQRDDQYAHEVFDTPPFDGLLLSKTIVEGIDGNGKGSRYTVAHRQRLKRVGVREFFRLDTPGRAKRLETLGDCGAFSYVREKEPPFSPQSVLDFYTECGFDYGMSVDHVILGYNAKLDGGLPGLNSAPADWKERKEITLELASEFLRLHRSQKPGFVPLGVAQGWSAASYADSVKSLQKMGYKYIAIGGIVPLRTPDLMTVMESVGGVRRSSTGFHLLGVTRCDQVGSLSRFGVVSFDSTSPLRKAFKDDTHNYYTAERTYSAIRIPQVQGNPQLQRRIASGQVDQAKARQLERQCLSLMRSFELGSAKISKVLPVLAEYGVLFGDRKDRTELYREVLEDAPWKQCSCNVCKHLGIHVIIFRGAERNRRRGFHNLFVTYQNLHRELAAI